MYIEKMFNDSYELKKQKICTACWKFAKQCCAGKIVDGRRIGKTEEQYLKFAAQYGMINEKSVAVLGQMNLVDFENNSKF
jgi:hypothetical protein